MFRTTKIRQYLKFMEQRGFSGEEIAQKAGLDYDRLNNSDYLVEFIQCRDVISQMIELTGDEGLGLKVGAEFQIADLGIIGYAVLSSKNLRQAAELWVKYSNGVAGVLIKTSVSEDEDSWSLASEMIAPSGFVFRFCVEEYLVATCSMAQTLTGLPLKVRSLELGYRKPPYWERYRDYVAAPVTFGCKQTKFTFETPPINSPLALIDDELSEVCVRHCDDILRRVMSGTPVGFRVRSELLKHAGSIPGADEMAKKLGFSARQFRRLLAEENLSYRHVVSEYRHDLAREYLKSQTLSVGEIAYLLGYKDHNAFRRAFKSWSGMSVGKYRKTDPV